MDEVSHFAHRPEGFGGLLLHIPSERLQMVSQAQYAAAVGLLDGRPDGQIDESLRVEHGLAPATVDRLIAGTRTRLERPEAFEATPEMIRTFTENLTAPINVVWQFTGACNLKCRHCFLPAEEHKAHQASPEGLLQIAEILVRRNILIVRLSGGEPTCHPALPDLLTILKSTPRHIKLLTNATLVDDRLIALIRRHVDSISVSLDGASAATHDRIRGLRGTFDRAIAGLRRIRGETALPVNVTTSICEDNLPEVGAIIDLCLELGIHSWKHTLTIPVGRASRKGDAMLTEAQFADLMRAVEPYRNEPMVASSIHLLDAYVEPEPAPTWCGGAFDEAAISPAGRLYPCAYVSGLGRYDAGSLLEADFDTLYRGEAFRAFRGDGEIEMSPDCKAIRLAYFDSLDPGRTVYDPAAIRAMLASRPSGSEQGS